MVRTYVLKYSDFSKAFGGMSGVLNLGPLAPGGAGPWPVQAGETACPTMAVNAVERVKLALIGQRPSYIGMVGAQCLFPNHQGPLEVGDRLCVAAGVGVQQRQVV